MVALLVGVVVVSPLLLVGAVLLARRTRAPKRTFEELGPIRPAVRLLTNDDELRDAIDRAVAYEQVTARRTSARIDRYHRIVDEQLQPTAQILDFESSAGQLVFGRVSGAELDGSPSGTAPDAS